MQRSQEAWSSLSVNASRYDCFRDHLIIFDDCVFSNSDSFISKRMTKVGKGHEGQYHVVGSGSPRPCV